ncbi:MAG: hypothetical protein AB7F89_15555 [Pirellulaceae bacterium]
MIRHLTQHSVVKWFAGLVTGLLLSTLGIVAVLSFTGYFEQEHLRWLERQLHAAAAQSGGTLSVATGYIEPGVEGIFVLDAISGDLTCGVLNPRSGQIAGLFRRNVAADLGVQQGKQPKYLMVTGAVEQRSQISNVRPALSLVYVADATTGRYAGYMMPWNTQVINQNQTIAQTFIPIGGGSARNVPIE